VAVGIQVGSIIDEIGTPSFFHAFFSTVSVHCEPNGWASRFPCLMGKLYNGELLPAESAIALLELHEAHVVLSKVPPASVVWDIEDRAAQPPWGSNISSDITSLGNYFVSSTGRNLFDLLTEALIASVEEGRDAKIV
jgi:2,3-bisphosphoglycerate-dependent phosphoglycerate mutase